MGVKQVAGGYLIIVGVIVAVFFVINSYFDANDTFDVLSVWYVLDVLMLIGLVIGLWLNWAAKSEERQQDAAGDSSIRRYIAVNALFYTTAAVTILFLHNYIALLSYGGGHLDGNHSTWVFWGIIDTLLPLVLITTGLRQLRGV